MASEEMSREEKEALLNKRMEEIRQKNAALKKRYEEIEADKRLAKTHLFKDKAEVTINKKLSSEPTDCSQLEQPLNYSKPQPSNCRKPQQLRTRRVESLPQANFGPSEHEKKRHQRLSEDDGPPPDPTNRFLADRSRDNCNNSASNQDRRRGSRRHPGNYGGQDFNNVKSTIQHQRTQDKLSPRQPPQNKMEMTLRMTGKERCEYEQWRSEQNRIERDRISRQKTSTGEWRREWDREKILHSPGKGRDDDNAELQQWWRGKNRGGDSHEGKGVQERLHSDQSFDRSRIYQKDETKSQAEVRHCDANNLSPRQVNLKDDSINISINNDFALLNTVEERHYEAFDTCLQQHTPSSQEDKHRRNLIQSETQQDSQMPKVTVELQKTPQPEVKSQCKLAEGELVPSSLVVSLNERSVMMGDFPDDESEGSWEDVPTSGTESPDLSQPNAEVDVNSQTDEVFSVPGVGKEDLTTLSLDNGKQVMCTTIVDHSTAKAESHCMPISVTRESTPLVDIQTLALPHICEDTKNDLTLDQVEMIPKQESSSSNMHNEVQLQLGPAVGQSNKDICSNMKISETNKAETEQNLLQPSQMATSIANVKASPDQSMDETARLS